MRCITAICPAGPPKLSSATREPDHERLAEARCRARSRSTVHRSDVAATSRHGFALLVGQLWVSLGRVAAPAIERIVEQHPGLKLLQIVVDTCAKARASGEQTGRLRREIEPRGVGGAHDRREALQRLASRARIPRPSRRTCTVRRDGSRSTSSMSNGVALNRSATACTSAAATNRNTAPGSTKRRISQGQAMRSILGRARVTQTVRPCASRAGSLPAGPAAAQLRASHDARLRGLRPATPACRSQAAAPSLSFWPFLANHDDRTARVSCGAQSCDVGMRACATAPGMRRGSAAKSSSVRTSIDRRRIARCRSAWTVFGGNRSI